MGRNRILDRRQRPSILTLERDEATSSAKAEILFDLLREKNHEVIARPAPCLRRPSVPSSPDMALPGNEAFELATYYPIFIYLAAILAFAGVSLVLAQAVGPRRKTPVKLMPYESGMDPIGDARQHFDVKFYLIAILFLVFDVELLFLYPWAVVAYRDMPLLPAEFSWPVFWEVMVFLVTLALGYVYAWREGVFRWR
jgi:NADH-quinone oxidoreductase subunit A